MLRSSAFAALLIASLGQPLAAQMSEVQPGTRVRVQAPGIVAGKFEGTVLTRTADTIVVGGPSAVPVHVPLVRLTSLEISRGKSRTDGAIAGMKWGVPIFATTGAALAIAAGSDGYCNECSDFSFGDGVAATTTFALVGAIYGAGIGAIIGRERWDAFDLGARTSFRIDHGRVGVGISLGF